MDRCGGSEVKSVGGGLGGGFWCGSHQCWCFRGGSKCWSGPGGCNTWSIRSSCRLLSSVSYWWCHWQIQLLLCYRILWECGVEYVWVLWVLYRLIRHPWCLEKLCRFWIPSLRTWQSWLSGTRCGCLCFWWGGWAVCRHFFKVGRQGKKGLQISCVCVLCRYRTHL